LQYAATRSRESRLDLRDSRQPGNALGWTFCQLTTHVPVGERRQRVRPPHAGDRTGYAAWRERASFGSQPCLAGLSSSRCSPSWFCFPRLATVIALVEADRLARLHRLRHRFAVAVPPRVAANRVDVDSAFLARSEHYPGSGWDRDSPLSLLRDRPPKYLDSGQRALPSWSLRLAPGRWLRSRLPHPGPSRPRRYP
jgi:hypothetical protein